MNYPSSISERPTIHPRMGIKSSLPKAKKALAAALLIKEVENESEGIQYSLSKKADSTQLEFDPSLVEKIYNWVKGLLPNENLNVNELSLLLNSTALILSQIEHLQVLFENYWKIAKIDHISTDNVTSKSERTGNLRYPKKIIFTTNADLLTILFRDISLQTSYARLLLAWLREEDLSPNPDLEKKIIKSLTILSEPTLYKLKRRDGVDVIFDLLELYKTLIETRQPVFINSYKLANGNEKLETKGTLRILNSTIAEGLNYFLEKDGHNVKIKNGMYAELLQHVSNLEKALMMRDSYNDETKISGEPVTLNFVTDCVSMFERNRILFGAPGTGKSFKLNQDAAMLLSVGDATRVTFHPEYSYFNFIGSYKPIMKEKKGDTSEEIVYDFVPGPFTTVLVEALRSAQNGETRPHLLIIEEINRSRVASVFGEVFQLLDRDEEGVSEYSIKPSLELKNYLEKQLNCSVSTIRIPNNMYIWATMNSADQGVFPMDTAFKRRWDFEYIGVDYNEELASATITICEKTMNWNTLRKSINQKLESLGINEDKLLGPFFIAKKYLDPLRDGVEITEDEKKIAEAKFLGVFKSKVISYLFDDAAKHVRSKLFEGCESRRYSHICQKFDEIGISIFGSPFTFDIDV